MNSKTDHKDGKTSGCCGSCGDKKTANTPQTYAVKDPVCGMDVDPHKTEHSHSHEGVTYYFCSAGCLKKFKADPEHYLSGAHQNHDDVPEGTPYTCPMHPEIVHDGPGNCPICGMALEPKVISLEDALTRSTSTFAGA